MKKKIQSSFYPAMYITLYLDYKAVKGLSINTFSLLLCICCPRHLNMKTVQSKKLYLSGLTKATCVEGYRLCHPKYASLAKDYFEKQQMQEKLGKQRSYFFSWDIYIYTGNNHL